jgi:demethylmenaquinone methyltransferase/2-methoxy-6-polyprenyl-1,4-benzoquinol methylase
VDPVAAESLLPDQVAYYRVVAPEYDEGVLRDRTELERPELEDELARFDPTGDVLELAGGTGCWTVELARYASRLTVVDASPETLAISRAKVAGSTPPVEYVVADLFEWRPPRAFDVVFFSFWLTHVPPAGFDGFWRLVAQSLRPGGRVFFIDDARPRLQPADHVVGDDPERGVSLRELSDGRQYQIVKVYWQPDVLEQRLATLGFDLAVRVTGQGHCIVGQGARQQR